MKPFCRERASVGGRGKGKALLGDIYLPLPNKSQQRVATKVYHQCLFGQESVCTSPTTSHGLVGRKSYASSRTICRGPYVHPFSHLPSLLTIRITPIHSLFLVFLNSPKTSGSGGIYGSNSIWRGDSHSAPFETCLGYFSSIRYFLSFLSLVVTP